MHFSKVHTCMCRNDSSAKTSDICEQAYSPSSIRALFEGFRSQAENSLLFLKSVTKLSVHVKAAGSQSPQLLFQATASAQVLSWNISLGWPASMGPLNQILEPMQGRSLCNACKLQELLVNKVQYGGGLQVILRFPLACACSAAPMMCFCSHICKPSLWRRKGVNIFKQCV